MTLTAAVEWRDHSACRDLTPEPFFDAIDRTAAAKAVCAACPVAAECLDYAQANRIEHGVWGGYDEDERRRFRRRAARGRRVQRSEMILAHLADVGTATAATIGEATGTSTANASTLLQRLVQLGKVETFTEVDHTWPGGGRRHRYRLVRSVREVA